MKNRETESEKPVDSEQDKFKKAARILLALGEDTAASVLRHLTAEETEKLASELMRTDPPTENEKKELLKQFRKEVASQSEIVFGGRDQAQKMLIKTLGEEKAARYLERLDKKQLAVKFKEFEEYQPDTLAAVLGEEIPQTSALVLAHMTPVFSAKVLAEIEKEKRGNIARRIARMQQVHPDAVEAVYQTIRKKLDAIDEDPRELAGGEDRLAEILMHLDRNVEDQIIDQLKKTDKDMAQRIHDRLFQFEDLIQLESTEIRRLFEDIPQKEIWARALKGSGKDLSRHILGSVSMNRSADIVEEMQVMAPITLKEIESQRRIIMQAVEELESQGILYLHKDRETLIE